MLSVIVPVFNQKKYLKDCIESICCQTYRDIEIILVDDGSVDGSGEICDAYKKKDNRIKVIHKKNGGLSSARNRGMSVATGEYICFIDSDDKIELSMFEDMLNVLRKENVDFVKCNFYKKEDDKKGDTGKVTIYTPYEACVNFLFEPYSLKKHMKSTSTDAIYKRMLFKDIQYKEGILNEDTQIFPQIIFQSKKIAHIDKSYYYYRDNSEGITAQQISTKKIESMELWSDVYDVVKQHSDLGDRVIWHWVTNLMYAYDAINTISDEGERARLSTLLKKLIKKRKKLFMNSHISKKMKLGIFILYRCPDLYNKMKRKICFY